MGHYITNRFESLAEWISNNLGNPYAFMIALTTVIIWAATGPLFDYSDTWQLVINTSTTIITFLMVFLLQNTVWCQSGYVVDCKSAYGGSIPSQTSKVRWRVAQG